MTYHEWEASVPSEFTDDSLWKVMVYRLGLFAAEIGWRDVTKLMSDRRTISLSDQLFRALGSIGGNVSEGYSRGTGRDRARFYEYSLGSSRESRGWYYHGRHVLGDRVASHRLKVHAEIIRLLLKMIPQQRARTIRESLEHYSIEGDSWVDVDGLDDFDQSILEGGIPFSDPDP